MPSAESNRTVLDYETEEALRKALMSYDPLPSPSQRTQEEQEVAASLGVDVPLSQETSDWYLTLLDHENSEVQSMKEELHRLQILKSYLLLDTEGEAVFDRITQFASRVFNVPISVVSLVDLGRQFFVSNFGLGDAKETPRKVAFCAHTILKKDGVLVVLDATKDFRFRENPVVTGGPGVRFYAGAPLISPEGFKLGTLCLVDTKTRDSFTADEESTLQDLAKMVVDAMVCRRQCIMDDKDRPAQLIAYTAHDLMTPLTGVQLSLALLNEDEDIRNKLEAHQMELLTSASTCSDFTIRICETSLMKLRNESLSGSPSAIKGNTEASSNDDVPVTKLQDLVKNLYLILEPFPKNVPLIIRLDPSVPPMILCDDLKLFRSATNLLSSAAKRTNSGYIEFRIYPKEDHSELVFECSDTAENIPVEEYPHLFQSCHAEDGNLRICLSSVASLISSVGGKYGFHPKEAEDRFGSGSIFWFSVPIFQTGEYTDKADTFSPTRFLKKGRYAMRADPIVHKTKRPVASGRSVASPTKGRATLALGDILVGAEGKDGSQSLLGFMQPARGDDSECDGAFVTCAISKRFPGLDQLTPAVESAEETSRPPVYAKPSAKLSAALAPPKRKKRALVIDDSLVVRKSLAMALKKMNFEVSQAVNGLEGLQLLQKRFFDLVLCDFLMPIMDGLDCVKQYREWERQERPEYRQVIIGISAHADQSVAKQGIEAGMDDFHPKPLSFKILGEIYRSETVNAWSTKLDIIEAASKPCAVDQESKAIVDEQEAKTTKKRPPEETQTNEDKKRLRAVSPSASSECLLLCPPEASVVLPSGAPAGLVSSLDHHGLKVSTVHDNDDALRLLQSRHWHAVLIDDSLHNVAECVKRLREWETTKHANRQKNIILVTDVNIPGPSDSNCMVQPPQGYDFVMQKPVRWPELKSLLQS